MVILLEDHMNGVDGSASFPPVPGVSSREEMMAGALIALLEWATKQVRSGVRDLEGGLREILSRKEHVEDPVDAVIHDSCIGEEYRLPRCWRPWSAIASRIGTKGERHGSDAYAFLKALEKGDISLTKPDAGTSN